MDAAVKPDEALKTVRLDVIGMTCAACSTRVEKVLSRMPGVAHASVNLPLETAEIDAVESMDPDALIRAVEKAGYEAKVHDDRAKNRRADSEEANARANAYERRTFLLLVFSALLSLPLIAPMIAMPFGLEIAIPALVQLALATPVQIFAGARFYVGAFKALRGGGANMDVLVTLGTSAAYGYSLFQIIALGPQHAGHLYFEASAVILTLILFGKLLELRAKRTTTSAIRSLMALRPDVAHRITDSGLETISVDDLREGDRILVKPGERVPADGEILEGESELDESLITGESLPISKEPGSEVIAGTINGSGALTVRTTALDENTKLARIIRLVEAAQTGKAPVQHLVDRVSAVFVPVIVVVALVTFASWLAFGLAVDEAVGAAVAVLVIACPCALGLATPTALVAGTGAAARAGILIRDIEALEVAHKIDTIVFDKTGTLTEGKPAVTDIRAFDRNEDRLIRIAASAQLPSEHPLAKAMIAEAGKRGLPLAQPTSFKSVPGRGLIATIAGEIVMIGNGRLMDEQGIDRFMADQIARGFEAEGKTCATVAVAGRVVGVIAMADRIREETPDALARLRSLHLTPVMLTGDTQVVAEAVAAKIGIDRVTAGVPPEGKAGAIARLHSEGATVAMVGDGINDAPALAAADVGIAMGEGADVAMETAGITLMRSRPELVADAIAVSRATVSKIRQNLFWAFIYNVIGIPLAAFGLLTPAVAGAAMALSSVSVVTNAGLLARWKPKADHE
ncbi:copper-translocating P-type ATPase [Rhizobiales bacterium]|uniref:heavy metal translocating P-type ATPase n=1 Tax=Hongsoonwoonella zoysiae TaxID=2821844 RepID=UPI0015613C97|nr:heavy metal translocating P-type ATPase [Hongsoonwoonella zoysiae]NRG17236.1 copper-translocating P-type ATPase [Hongsoonwoonella zoysiae]